MPELWKKFFAGAVAGSADVWICHPLDRLKTVVQKNPSLSTLDAIKHVYNRGSGFKGTLSAAYEGVIPMNVQAILKVGTRYYINLFVRDTYRNNFMPGSKKEIPLHANMLAGGLAGFLESYIVVIPTEMLKVRHMTQSSIKPFSAVFSDIIKNEGIFALYRGGTFTALRQTTNHMVRFPVFYKLSEYFKGGDTTQQLSMHLNLVLGGIAGTISTVANNPLDIIKTRLQSQNNSSTIPGAIKDLYKSHGIRGFWAGTACRVMRVSPGAAITLSVFEKVIHLLN